MVSSSEVATVKRIADLLVDGGSEFMPTLPEVALWYLISDPMMVSIKHTRSDFYQVQWGSGYGAGETPLLAIEKAIIDDHLRPTLGRP